MPSVPSRIIEQAKFTYSSLSKSFEKQIKTIEDQGSKENQELKSMELFFPSKMRNEKWDRWN